MDEILIFLFKKKAHAQPVAVTTSELGEATGMSQQNASRRLNSLEDEGYIKRTQEGILLTKKAYAEMASLYGSMKRVFEEGQLEIEGKITKGLGEGKYYLSMEGYKGQMKELLGFEPYPGTLNIEVKDPWDREQLVQLEPIVIKGFKDKERSYGDLFAYRCRLEKHECALIVPLRTHHGPRILEVVCPFNIRRKLGKKDGDMVKVVVW
jgi:riboflavin kinase